MQKAQRTQAGNRRLARQLQLRASGDVAHGLADLDLGLFSGAFELIIVQ
jgi:hypothetical protein